jgi:hypothetical protein
MIRTIFRDTMGKWHENPSPDWLKSLIYNRGDDFWDVGAGDTGIDFYLNGEQKAHINLKGIERYGFMVNHEYCGEAGPYRVLTTGEQTDEVVKAVVGGEPHPCFRKYFVPKETAWEAIEHFLHTGERKKDLHWEIARMPEEALRQADEAA